MTDSLLPQTARLDSGELRSAKSQLVQQLVQLRSIPGFPKAEDEAILRMSLPPTYTACPNPFMRQWLRESAPEGYDSEPYEDPGPFAADISVGKSHPIYKAHSFPTKVPHEAIMRFILHYTRPGDVILDGFCGTGMTGVAAQACGAPEPKVKAEIELELGEVHWGLRRAILQDLSPSATFIAAGVNIPVDAEAFDRRSKEILNRFDSEWGWMYETTHRNGKKGRIDYTIWSEVFTCPHCGSEVVFYDAAFEERTRSVKDAFKCPSCGAGVSKRGLERRKVRVRTLAGDIIERIEFRPVRIHYRTGMARYEKIPDKGDLEVLRKVASIKVPSFPSQRLPYMHETHERHNFPAYGMTHLHHLFSDRALTTLAVLWDWCSSEENPYLRLSLLFWVEQAIWGLSWMNRWRPEGFSHVNQYQTGVYYVPAIHAECSPRYNLGGSDPARGKRASLVKTWAGSPARAGQIVISTASSTRLDLPEDSVDYIFVDPPFGANISYSDLAHLVESWHQVWMDDVEEAIVTRNKERPKQLPNYQELMEGCFREFYRVLKPGRWMTVEFNSSSNRVWLAIQEAISAAGFVVADVRIFDKQQPTYVAVTAKNVVKRDLIISAYKPAKDLEDNFSLVAGTEEGAWEFIREHLAHLPVTEGKRGEPRVVRERMGDRLFDRMVAYHVHRGYVPPLTAAEFYAGLERRFPVRDDMYLLPEQVEAYERHRLTFKELAAAELFITNESSAVAWLRRELKAKPRTFAEIQPAFFRELQPGPPEWENLPDLRVLLDENFLQDEKGRWYVPDPKKAADLEKLRTKALLREFVTYTEGRGRLERFRSEAVRAGFKDAWARRDFALIVKVGERLPDDAFAEDEQLLYYYDNARKLRG